MKTIYKILKVMLFFLMDETGNLDVGALGGDNTPPPPQDGASGTPEPDPLPSIHGDLTVEWPEGLDETLREEMSLKPFVTKEGKINYANVLKSYVHANKMVGKDKLVMPGEYATEEEIADFHTKLGWVKEPEEYKITYGKDGGEEGHLEESFLQDLTQFAYSNKIPVATAQKIVDFMEEQAAKGSVSENEAQIQSIKEGLAGLQKEYGQAFEAKIGVAKRVLSEVVEDESIIEAMKDPSIGSNPHIIKTLVKIGEKLFKEDGIRGEGQNGLFSPEEAQNKIDEIYGNPNHPYHHPNHPQHAKATKDMQKLFEMRG